MLKLIIKQKQMLLVHTNYSAFFQLIGPVANKNNRLLFNCISFVVASSKILHHYLLVKVHVANHLHYIIRVNHSDALL